MLTSSKSTSPQSFPFSSLSIPTSITAAPSFTNSLVTNFAFPIAATRISACFVMLFKSFVCEWQMVTVPFSRRRSIPIGFPTILLLPIITQCFPSIEMSERFKSSIIPFGVQETIPFSPMLSLPTLIGEKPSTSLSGAIVRIIRSSSMCFGSGS